MARRGWGETVAAYRFLGNDEFDWQAILAPHWERTREWPIRSCCACRIPERQKAREVRQQLCARRVSLPAGKGGHGIGHLRRGERDQRAGRH